MHDEKEREQNPAESNDEATSSETLSDVEKNENVSEEPTDKGSSDPISPDGITRTDNSERVSKDDGGPM